MRVWIWTDSLDSSVRGVFLSEASAKDAVEKVFRLFNPDSSYRWVDAFTHLRLEYLSDIQSSLSPNAPAGLMYIPTKYVLYSLEATP